MLVSLLLASSLAGCVGGADESDDANVVASYEVTNATIVEYWEDGQLVSTQYPSLTFDFARSTAPSAFVAYSVDGEHATGQTDASESTLVEVEFTLHGLHRLELNAEYTASTGKATVAIGEEILVRIEKQIMWEEESTNNPAPMMLDTRNEAGDVPASVLVIDSTVHNPDLIANIGGGQDVEVSWALIDETDEACQSQPGTVEDGDSATWKTVHFNTYEVHELHIVYEEGQDLIDVQQSVSIEYEQLETLPNL
mgnify:FL=1